ncbi:hypothetical protein TSAR_001293 [Trichomalopsis sarcophagae]|uniref:Uncharacterized protein n=1 Tax=Trichomalopsis sarcophagae TaxID=543379 RepID=A0A232FAX2_9HYME|nr:hypothetical protein TSAR_001293 [Trichomalopsis sarcophagae]
MRRAHYTAYLWNKATLLDMIEFEPETSGWTLTNNKYDFLWFEGPQLPLVILDNHDSEVDDEESEYDSDEDPEIEGNIQYTD